MKTVVLLIVSLLLGQISLAQDENIPDIQIPSTPGLSIIGVQNTEISKPGNYAGLYTSLISPIVSNNGTIPTDLSVEFSPYYLKSRDITFNEIGKTNIYRDLRISIASTSIVGLDSSTFARLGIGFKTNLLNGNGKITVSSSDKKNKVKLSVASDVNTVITKINAVDVYGNIDTADISLFMDHISDENSKLRKQIKKLILEYKDNKAILILELKELEKEIEAAIEVDDSRWNNSLRTGSFLEFSGAFALDFPDNRFNHSKINRWGVWLGYTYRPKNKLGIFDLGTIFRISNYSFDPAVYFDNEAIFGDFGGSLNLRIPKTRLTLSAEWIGKFGFTDLKATDSENQYTFKSVTENKWNVTIGYQITKSVIWTISLSEFRGNSDYLRDKTLQFLMGISASLVPLKQ